MVASSAFTDRLCIANSKIFNEHLSVANLVFCCKQCHHIHKNSKEQISFEASLAEAWKYYRDIGVRTDIHFSKYYDVGIKTFVYYIIAISIKWI